MGCITLEGVNRLRQDHSPPLTPPTPVCILLPSSPPFNLGRWTKPLRSLQGRDSEGFGRRLQGDYRERRLKALCPWLWGKIQGGCSLVGTGSFFSLVFKEQPWDRPPTSPPNGKEGMLWMPSVKEFQLAESRRRAFSALAPALWNIFPSEVRLAPTF